MKKISFIFAAGLLAACNVVNIKPHSLDKSQLIYADRGGYSMKFAVKQELEDRGYKITVGKNKGVGSNEDSSWSNDDPLGAKYVIKVQEKIPDFSPLVCLFGGFYWWHFNVSIADQKTGEELLAWTGRGCQGNAIRRLRRLMDKLEQK
jgi:hypothetical protein